MWGALISGGLSLVSGLFARNDAKKALKAAQAAQAKADEHNISLGSHYRKLPYVAMGELVSDAEKHGFNPLTILRAGGLSAYGKAQQVPGYQMQMIGPAPTANIPSMGSVVAGALSAGFNTYRQDAIRHENMAFQNSLMDKSFAQNMALRAVGFGTGNSVMGGNGTKVAGGLSGKAGAFTGAPQKPEVGKVEVSNPWNIFHVDPSVRNANAMEDRYGDDGGGLMGSVFNTMSDFWYNVTDMTSDQRYKAMGQYPHRGAQRVKAWVKDLAGGLSIKFKPDEQSPAPLWLTVKPVK